MSASCLVRPASAVAMRRERAFSCIDGTDFDVAIIGAGITGAAIFHQFSRRGQRVLLLDHGDFGSGTSQASGMMIWGGLLYLKDFDLKTVIKLCRARDLLIEQMPADVRAQSVRYLPGREALRNRHVVRAGMLLYWLLGSWKRRFPRSEAEFSEGELLARGRFRESLTVEEAVLRSSDSRFVLEWILAAQSEQTPALSYCAMQEARFDAAGRRWHLDLRDRQHGHEAAVTAHFVVNASGVWTDTVNNQLGVESPYRHQLSKGVYIAVRRPKGLQHILVFDTGENHDVATLVPWGPVAMCGPTETPVADLSGGFQVAPEDARSLLRLANKNLHPHYGPEDVVSMRCGVRPLAVRRRASPKGPPSALSRKHLVYYDRYQRAIAVYGGKLTSCRMVAEEIMARLSPHFSPPLRTARDAIKAPSAPAMGNFPGLDEPMPAAEWCRDYEHCYTIDDYLRRRTNIAQWVHRGGLGRNGEHREVLRQIARVFAADEEGANDATATYEGGVRERHDTILAAV